MLIEVIDNENYLDEESTEIIEHIVQATAVKLGLDEANEVDISIVSNEVIKQLNKQYRQIDQVTDVLSFALEENLAEAPQINETIYGYSQALNLPARHLGDIIIAYPRAVEQAHEYGHSIQREIAFLSVHGFLHLNGFDHQSEEEEAIMFGIQEEVLVENGYTR